MKILRFLFILFLTVSCSKPQEHRYTFYYWKTHLSLDRSEKDALQKASLPYLYTRLFDVDKMSGKFQPVGVITRNKSFITGKQIIPTVFITNRTFLNITHEETRFLVESIYTLIEKKSSEYHLKTGNEIQIDCDWTAGTRDDYFKFLNELKKISRKSVTCTLRLHQVKDKKQMGIPPVDKVYLMCYSTSSPLEDSDKNSILDVNILKSYLSKIEDYPVKSMAVALPIYSWGIVTNHLGKHRLINALSAKDLENPSFKKISDTEAEVLKDGFYFGHYLNKGFRVKVEEISDAQLQDVVGFLEKKIKPFDIIYYQLDRKFVTGQPFDF
ncbi:hypothetical protein FY557_07745 [Chryseobacterium sp. SN22]|uniref:hypothetical protein n=1 Tax=Chryseobacterium sp. SN22 TaxID=2606431 RepID=UPI0011EDA68A|nr:hypothetical protein [Chryseobacterium sp. SN22]KAA0128761.1 hypothetical protein FY557_07745 [Chryseobacterium sp. SN22]